MFPRCSVASRNNAGTPEPAMARAALMPTERSRVLLPELLQPDTSRTLPGPSSAKSGIKLGFLLSKLA